MKKLITLLLAAALLLAAPITAAAEEAPAADPAPTVDPNLVTDDYTFSGGNEWGSFNCHVPVINLPGDGIALVNKAIWNDVYASVLGEYGAMNAVEEGYTPMPSLVDYTWAVNGDVLSLIVFRSYEETYMRYDVYNVSLTQGRHITNDELLSVLGVTDSFYDRVRTVMSNAFEEGSVWAPEDEMKASQRAFNNSDENIHAVRPYLDANGDLCIIGRVAALAGAGEYAHELTVMSRDELPVQSVSTAGLPAETPLEDRLMYFMQNSDTTVYTRDYLEGFDSQMCTYALNGIYARAGRIFENDELYAYYCQFSWYQPEIPADQFSDTLLSDCQRQNIDLILAYKTEMGF